MKYELTKDERSALEQAFRKGESHVNNIEMIYKNTIFKNTVSVDTCLSMYDFASEFLGREV